MINKEFWRQLLLSKKKTDFRLLQTVRKVAVTILQTVNEFLLQTRGTSNENPVTRFVDAIAKLDHFSHEFSSLRREQRQPTIRPVYSPIFDYFR